MTTPLSSVDTASKPLAHRPFGMSLLIAILLCPLAAFGQTIPLLGRDDRSSPPADAQPNTITFSTAAEIRERRQKLAAEIAIIEQEVATASAETANHTTLVLGHLKFLDSTLAQQTIVAERAKEVQAETEQLREQANRHDLLGDGANEVANFVDLERMRDDWEDLGAQVELNEQELKSSVSLLESLKEQYAANERQRRQVKESLDRQTDDASAESLRHELRVIELRGRIAVELVSLRTQELQVKRLEQQMLTAKQAGLEAIIRSAETSVRFTDKDLDILLGRLDDEQQRLNQQILTQQMALRRFEMQVATLPTPFDRETNDRIRSIRRLIYRGIADGNDSLANLLLVRHAWKLRYKVLNNQLETEELGRNRPELEKYFERIRDAQQLQQTRSQENRLVADVANRDQVGDPTDTLAGLQAQLISETFRESGKRNRLLRQGERLYTRLQAEIDARLGIAVAPSVWEQLVPKLASWWNYELVAVDDRPITVGKLVLGCVMVVGGVLAARTLSRAVGHRMLPKLGIHQGASMAAQTIAFYALVGIFGLFTLEYLNIPITVLTFFGGAAAIAIGFGSQNILNNFISGLIILGEQPIRIGDLIEIDGVHGTIEHIGGRSTRVRTSSNFTIFVPNSKFVENSIKNLSRSNSEFRTIVTVGVAYDSDVDQVTHLLRQAVDETPLVLKRPEPVVLFTAFADSSLNFEVQFWIHMRALLDTKRAESLVRKNIDRLFREHGITISYQQRDLHIDFTGPLAVKVAEGLGLSELPSRDRAA